MEMNRLALSVSAALVLGVCASPTRADKAHTGLGMAPTSFPDVDPRAFKIDGSRMRNTVIEGGIAGAPIQTWSFEAPGFNLGQLMGQQGWQAFTGGVPVGTGGNENTPVVGNNAPTLGGAQSIEIPKGPQAGGTFNGPFGPTASPQPGGDYTVNAKIRIPNFNGADYYFIPQSPAQMLLTARVNFLKGDIDPDGTGPMLPDGVLGDIIILDDPDGVGPQVLGFYYTGAHWTPNTTHNLRIEVDAPAIRYFLDNTLIFTGATGWGGTSVEQVVVPSDNNQIVGERGKLDDINFEPGVNATPCPANIVTTGTSATRVDVDDLLAVISQWGNCPAPPAACPANIVTTGTSATRVDVDDLLAVISQWGPCP